LRSLRRLGGDDVANVYSHGLPLFQQKIVV
jgi:hypothetical protein